MISILPTLVLGGAGDLAEQLDEVGQVIAEELGLEHQVLARVVGVEAGAQELGFADNAQRRPSFGALEVRSVSLALHSIGSLNSAYPESEVGKALGQAGQRLEARAGLCDKGQCRRRAGKVSAGVLDALGLAGLVLEGA